MAEQKQMHAHTPGPWSITRSKMATYGAFDYTISANRVPVFAKAFGRDGNGGWPSAEANARLIAAAPDLLAALRDALELAKLAESLTGCRGDDDYVRGLQEKFAAAIAKAEGRATGAEG